LRERHAAEHRAYTAAAKKIEEDDHKEEVRNWAAEVVEEDLRKKDLKNKDQIHLKDAVGRKIAVPFSQGRTWQVNTELPPKWFVYL
jgi:hypothetical protein